MYKKYILVSLLIGLPIKALDTVASSLALFADQLEKLYEALPTKEFNAEDYTHLEKVIDQTLKEKNLGIFTRTYGENLTLPVKIAQLTTTIALNKQQYNLSYDFELANCIVMINKLVAQIIEAYPNKDETIVYACVASGGLLYEYMLLKALLLAGYRSILLYAIDLIYKDGVNSEQVQHLRAQLLKDSLDVYEEPELPLSTPYKNRRIGIFAWISMSDCLYRIIEIGDIPKISLFTIIQTTDFSNIYPNKEKQKMHTALLNKDLVLSGMQVYSLQDNLSAKIHFPFYKNDTIIISTLKPDDEAFLEKELATLLKKLPSNNYIQEPTLSNFVTLSEELFKRFPIEGISFSPWPGFFSLLNYASVPNKPLIAYENIYGVTTRFDDHRHEPFYNFFKPPKNATRYTYNAQTNIFEKK